MIAAEVNFLELDVALKRIEPQRVLSIFAGMAVDVFHRDEVVPLDAPRLGEKQHETLLPVKEIQPVALIL